MTVQGDTRRALTPADVLALIRDGNRRFVSGRGREWDDVADQRALGRSQEPVAVVLGCIDSRAPAELIFDAHIGDMLNARVAGNVVTADIAGCVEFACGVAGARLVLVLGHTDCGAVKGAIDGVELGNLTGLLEKLEPAVRSVMDVPVTQRDSTNPAYVDAVAEANVRLTIDKLRDVSPILRDLENEGKIIIAGAMHDVETGVARFLD